LLYSIVIVLLFSLS